LRAVYRILVGAQAAAAEAFGIDHVSCISDPARERRTAVTDGRSAARPCESEDQPPSVEESNAFLVDDAAGRGRRDSGSMPMIGNHRSRRATTVPSVRTRT